jgi:hypothetical protein
MQMSSEENTFRSGLRLELPYLVDALAKDHGFLHDARQFRSWLKSSQTTFVTEIRPCPRSSSPVATRALMPTASASPC